MDRIILNKLTKEEASLPFYSLFHPIDAFETMKYKKTGSYRLCLGILFVWVLSEVLLKKNIGFVYSTANPDKVNIYDVMFGTLAVFIILVASNFLLCTLMEGEGTFKQIFCFMSYFVIIRIISNVGFILLTSLLSIEMASFLVLYSSAINIWSAVYILLGLMTVHQFSFGKTILNIFLTLIGAAFIAGLIFLLYSLFQQVASFFYTIYNEILFRF